MKKIIVLVLILIITPFFIVSEEPLVLEINKIKLENIKNPELKKWEFIKDRVFYKNGVLEKGYDKPVLITLDENATDKDSIIVSGFIEELKILMPSVLISLEFSKKVKPPYHYVNVSFKKGISDYGRFNIKTNLPGGSILKKTDPNKMTVTSSDGSKYSHLNFEFNDTISDDYRKMFLTGELLKTIFLTPHMSDSFNNKFQVALFNDVTYDPTYVFFGGLDKFLLQKLYSDDFSTQFEDYLYANYPWRYANSFLNKEMTARKAMIIVLALGLLVFILMMSVFQNKKFKYSFFNYFLPVLFLLFHLGNLSSIYKYLTNFNSFIGWDENIIFMLITIPPVALLISILLWLFDKYVVKNSMNFTLQLISKVTFTFIIFNIPLGLLFLLNEDENILNSEFQDFYFPILYILLGLALGRGILIYLNHFSESLVKEKDVELSRLKEINAQSELKLLQSHINPHFLYNALNSIAGLAHTNADKTEKMALSLSDLFRYSINKKGEKMSTIKEEVTMVENYLDIEKIRFGDRLTFQLDIDKSILDKKIPMYILQPLVENAIKHGISKIRGEAKIALQIIKEENNLFIRVSDNGPDFPKSLISGHGLQTVNDLLRLSYGDNASLTWENAPKKTITINLPLNH